MALSITKPTVGGSEDTWGTTINTALDAIVDEINDNADGTNAINLKEGSFQIGGTAVTATAAELNYVDGVTSNVQTQIDAINSFPVGGIIMWSGAVADIPSGWALCDGTNSTPNLVDRFIIGSATDSGATHDIGDTGGANSLTLTEGQLPSHTHGTGNLATATAGAHTHNQTLYSVGLNTTPVYGGGWENTNGVTANQATSSAGAHTHTLSGNTGSTGSGSSIDNRPAYYALAFIMKT